MSDTTITVVDRDNNLVVEIDVDARTVEYDDEHYGVIYGNGLCILPEE